MGNFFFILLSKRDSDSDLIFFLRFFLSFSISDLAVVIGSERVSGPYAGRFQQAR